MRQQAITSQAASAFSLEEDGVYYGADKESSVAGQRICSPLKILGKLRTPESLEWSRLVGGMSARRSGKRLSSTCEIVWGVVTP